MREKNILIIVMGIIVVCSLVVGVGMLLTNNTTQENNTTENNTTSNITMNNTTSNQTPNTTDTKVTSQQDNTKKQQTTSKKSTSNKDSTPTKGTYKGVEYELPDKYPYYSPQAGKTYHNKKEAYKDMKDAIDGGIAD